MYRINQPPKLIDLFLSLKFINLFIILQAYAYMYFILVRVYDILKRRYCINIYVLYVFLVTTITKYYYNTYVVNYGRA